MKVVAIIQARLGSTRLPGKVLQDIGGSTMLARVVRRTQRAGSLDDVAVATSVEQADGAVVTECGKLGVTVLRGNEQDVLDRYYQSAKACSAEVVVRITSDCPLIEPEIIDKVVHAFLDARADYGSNVLERTYPRGLDTEVMTVSALERAWQNATARYQRAHVTPYLYENPDQFRLLSVRNDQDYSGYRWTVDTPDDLAFVRKVYQRLGGGDAIHWKDVVALLKREPQLAELNRAIGQKALHEG